MKLFHFERSSSNTGKSEKEYTHEMISHQQLYDESEGGEFLDDAIRTHEQQLFNAEDEVIQIAKAVQ